LARLLVGLINGQIGAQAAATASALSIHIAYSQSMPRGRAM